MVENYVRLTFRWMARFGDFNLESTEDDVTAIERKILRVYLHPQYDEAKLYFDIAIVKVVPVQFSIFVRAGSELTSYYQKLLRYINVLK